MIRINGERWRVMTVPYNSVYLQKSNGEFAIGVCDDRTKTIYLNEALEGRMLKKVLCHELTHAAMFSYDIDLSHDQEELLANIISTYGEEIIDITNIMFKKLKEGF